MLARSLGVLGGLVFSFGCSPSEAGGDDQAPADAGTPVALYEPFVSKAWSMAIIDGHVQVSISDQAGEASCAMGVDQHNHLPSTGRQIIFQLPETTTDACPQGSFTQKKCSNEIGNAALVPMGCTYYRKFDDTGAVVGVSAALDGTMQIAGTERECALRVNVGFYGASFTETLSLQQSPGTQPWCYSGQ